MKTTPLVALLCTVLTPTVTPTTPMTLPCTDKKKSHNDPMPLLL